MLILKVQLQEELCFSMNVNVLYNVGFFMFLFKYSVCLSPSRGHHWTLGK